MTTSYYIDTLSSVHSKNYFIEGTDIEKIAELINEQELPLLFYKDCTFSDVLIIERDDAGMKFLLNTVAPSDRTKLRELADSFISMFPEKGSWVYDLKNLKLIYDFNAKKASLSGWCPILKEEFGQFIAVDGMNKNLIRIYNSSKISSLYWGIFYINKYFSNNLGALADERGVLLALNYVYSLFNIPVYTPSFFMKEIIVNAIQIYEKDIDTLPNELLRNLLQKINISNAEEEKNISPKVIQRLRTKRNSLTLSKEGKILLSELLYQEKFPSQFFPVELDMVLDPRIVSAWVHEGKLIFCTSVDLESRAKETIYNFTGKKDIEIIPISKATGLMAFEDEFYWYEKFYWKGGVS